MFLFFFQLNVAISKGITFIFGKSNSSTFPYSKIIRSEAEILLKHDLFVFPFEKITFFVYIYQLVEKGGAVKITGHSMNPQDHCRQVKKGEYYRRAGTKGQNQPIKPGC